MNLDSEYLEVEDIRPHKIEITTGFDIRPQPEQPVYTRNTYFRNNVTITINEKKNDQINNYIRPPRPCVFCMKLFNSQTLAEHIANVHKNISRVKEILKLSVKDKKKEWKRLRIEGLNKYNKKVLDEKNKNFMKKILPLRKGIIHNECDGVQCPSCSMFMSLDGYRHHYEMCYKENNLNINRRMDPVFLKSLESEDIDFKQFNDLILLKLRIGSDESIREFILSSELLKYCGFRYFKKLMNQGKSKQTLGVQVRKMLRIIARLLLECRTKEKNLQLSDMFTMDHIEILKFGLNQLLYKEKEKGSSKANLKDGISTLAIF